MRILNLSLDQQLLKDNPQGDTLERFLGYAKRCELFIVLVPTTNPQLPQAKEISGKIKIHAIYSANKLFTYLKLVKMTRERVVADQIQLVVTNDLILGFLAKVATIGTKVKVQANVFGLQLTNRYWLTENWKHPLLALLQLIAVYWVDSLRTDTKVDRDQVVKRLGVNRNKVIALPVPPAKEQQEKLKAIAETRRYKKSTSNQDFKLLTVSSLTANKNLANLIQAVALLDHKSFLLTILGSGPQKSMLVDLVASLKLKNRVKFVNSVSYTQLLDYYKNSDLLVMSSYLEGLPRVLIEAALSGVPIVSTRVAGAVDMIKDHKTGRLVPVKDPKALSNVIALALDDYQQSAAMAQDLYNQALKAYDFEEVSDKLTSNWKYLIYDQSI